MRRRGQTISITRSHPLWETHPEWTRRQFVAARQKVIDQLVKETLAAYGEMTVTEVTRRASRLWDERVGTVITPQAIKRSLTRLEQAGVAQKYLPAHNPGYYLVETDESAETADAE